MLLPFLLSFPFRLMGSAHSTRPILWSGPVRRGRLGGLFSAALAAYIYLTTLHTDFLPSVGQGREGAATSLVSAERGGVFTRYPYLSTILPLVFLWEGGGRAGLGSGAE